MKRTFILLLSALLSVCASTQTTPKPYGPTPNDNQIRWQEMEEYAFVHFSINTYTDQSWGNGDEDPQIFNPTELDCRQWARVCKESGMKGIIITAKHHSGFCLWPSKYTEYSVKNCPWKNGKGDIVREMANACKEYGLKLGMYLSPWDRNCADYGKPEYLIYFRNQLRELLTNYGDIFEIWFDGANGGTGYYGGAREERKIDPKTYYDWKNTFKLIRELQPNIIIWNDGGDRADIRWVGTEAGNVGETNWSLMNAKGDTPWEMLHYGVENGDSWVAAEVNTSIRPEWFYHPSEDTKVKSLPQLMDIYYSSVGRNGTLLLNFPIDTKGRIHENDAKAGKEFAQAIKEAFKYNLVTGKKATASNTRANSKKFAAANTIDNNKETYWATDDNVTKASLTIDLGKPTTFNRFLIQEYIRLGQRVKSFTVEAFSEGKWKGIAKANTIGYKRILCFPSVRASQVRLCITDSKSCPIISNIGIYDAPQILTQPSIMRDKNGTVTIIPADRESSIYYTTDGTSPTAKSNRYNAPFPTLGKIEIKAIAHDTKSGKSSPVCSEKFDLPHNNWKIINSDDSDAIKIIDGDPVSSWHQPKDVKMPADIIIDLGSKFNISGFRYLPDPTLWGPGIISGYRFFASTDNLNWKLVSEGEFSNIKNNPVRQIKTFTTTNARYVKFEATKNIENSNNIGYAEFDLITE